MGYQGYANRDTWVVDLWFDNEEKLYNAKIKMFNRAGNRKLVKSDIKNIVSRFQWTIKSNGDKFRMYKVDFNELVTVWNNEKDEHFQYMKDKENK